MQALKLFPIPGGGPLEQLRVQNQSLAPQHQTPLHGVMCISTGLASCTLV